MNSRTVSIVLCTKNSLALLKGAIESLCKQSYKNFDLIVVDGDSSDGTQAYLKQQPLNIHLISEPDEGISDAYAKGLRFATGDIVGILSADERYYPDALANVVQWFSENEDNIVCGGVCRFLNEGGEEVDEYMDDFLQLERHLTCEHICSISTSFFHRRLIGEEFYYSPDMETCMDYELWARLALLYESSRFRWFPTPIIQAYRTSASTSFRDDSFRRMVADKIAYLKQFLDAYKENERIQAIDIDHCAAGIHMWACEQLSYINYRSPEILYHCREALALDPDYKRISEAIRRHPLLDMREGSVVMYEELDVSALEYKVAIDRSCLVACNSACFGDQGDMHLITDDSAWGYSFELDLRAAMASGGALSTDRQHWLMIRLGVLKGTIGVGVLDQDNDIIGERIYRQSENIVDVMIPMPADCQSTIMLRSGGEGASETRVVELSIVC